MNEKQAKLKNDSMFSAKTLAKSGIVIAVYLVIMYLTQNFAFGQYQMRLATSLYALAAIHPFLILPLGLANLLSNLLFGGLGPFDAVGGFLVGILTASACWYIRKISLYLVALPVFLIPSLLVPVWLSYLLNLPYLVLAVSVGIGQILPAVIGIFLVKYLEKPLKGEPK